MHKKRFYERYIKRPQDFIFALTGLVLCSPVLLLVSVFVHLKLGSPVLFIQERPGRISETTGKEKIFRLYKFRSMTDQADRKGNLLPDEKRFTPFGKMLRESSLDELPELWNILKGDMSFVGPRPLLVRYLDRYTSSQRRRHEVRPGLTGLAQVNGRNAISWEEKFAYDTEYVDHITFAGDWKIILQTMCKVFKREGIHSGTSEIMDEFRGKDVI